MGQFRTILYDIIKVAVGAWGVTWVEPWVGQVVPTWHIAVRYLIAATVVAIVLEFMLQVFLGRARIEVTWLNQGASISELHARIRKSSLESQPFSLHISTETNGWLGHQVLKWFCARGAQLHISIPEALIFPITDNSSKNSGRNEMMIKPDDLTRGFLVHLEQPPRRPGLWQYADVRWKNETTPSGKNFNIYYILHHEKPLMQFFLRRLVSCTSPVEHFQILGS